MQTRRDFVRSTTALATAGGMGLIVFEQGAAVGQTPSQTPAQTPAPAQGSKSKGPPLAAAEVFEFVRSAHTDLDRVRTMLDANPALLNATWDWGGGDFETALGGASHMGRPDIAGLLLDRGARIDLFCATMLGVVPAVRAIVEAYPSALTWKGPHGISLLRHAQAGKQTAMIDYLVSKGAV